MIKKLSIKLFVATCISMVSFTQLQAHKNHRLRFNGQHVQVSNKAIAYANTREEGTVFKFIEITSKIAGTTWYNIQVGDQFLAANKEGLLLVNDSNADEACWILAAVANSPYINSVYRTIEVSKPQK